MRFRFLSQGHREVFASLRHAGPCLYPSPCTGTVQLSLIDGEARLAQEPSYHGTEVPSLSVTGRGVWYLVGGRVTSLSMLRRKHTGTLLCLILSQSQIHWTCGIVCDGVQSENNMVQRGEPGHLLSVTGVSASMLTSISQVCQVPLSAPSGLSPHCAL